MTKFRKMLKIIMEKKVLASLLAIIGMTIPQTAPWLGLNGSTLITTVSGILVALSLILAMYGEIPFKKKDESNKGGKK